MPAALWKQKLGRLVVGGALSAFTNSTVSVDSDSVQGKLGDLVLSSCTGNDTIAGAECGYAVYVFQVHARERGPGRY